MAFSDETNHSRRWFSCSWGPRAETAEQIAQRTQAMALGLKQAEPDLSPLWPEFSSRATRLTDPGPVDVMAIEDLGSLIDRRARFDPPQLPTPVAPTGYSIYLSGPPSRDPARRLDVTIYAGRTHRAFGNGCTLDLLVDAPLWRSAERGLAILHILLRAWEPDAGGGWAWIPPGEDDKDDGRRRVRPWLAWQRTGAADPLSYEHVGVGAPVLVRQELGGELRVWP